MTSSWCGMVVLAAIISSTARAAEPEASTPPQQLAAAPAPPRETVAPSKTGTVPTVSHSVTGAKLRNHSQQAFHRGLLPLSDFIEHLALAEEADVRSIAPAAANDPATSSQLLLSALQPRVLALRQAVRHLEAFAQPAAANWQSDLLLGRYVLTQAEAEAARLSGDHAAMAQATRIEAATAVAHYQQRVFDARILGHASLPEMTRAVSLLNVNPSRKRQVLQHAVGTTRQWNALGAGIGRADQVLQASLQVALWDAEPRTDENNLAQTMRGLSDADRLTARLFETQRTYYSRGTATLADLSRTWQTRRQVHLLADVAGATLPANSPVSYQRDLTELQTLAANVKDRRGRHASDVEFVSLLHQLHAGDRNEAPVSR